MMQDSTFRSYELAVYCAIRKKYQCYMKQTSRNIILNFGNGYLLTMCSFCLEFVAVATAADFLKHKSSS